jgi:hypothetical protein
MPLEALILDYGNVLSHSQRGDCFEGMAAHVGAPLNAFRDAYWQHRQPYDAGLPATGVLAASPGDALPFIRSIGAWPCHRSTDRGGRRFVDKVPGGDVGPGAIIPSQRGAHSLLSNGVPEAMARIRAERPVERWFDVVVVSCEVGVAKPDPTCAVLYPPACR